MHFPGKTVSPHITYLIMVFSPMLVSSIAVAVSPGDKKWLLDTLLTLRRELPQSPSSSYMSKREWAARGPAPIPTPTHWIPPDIYDYQTNPIISPADKGAIAELSKRQYGHSLLCCNSPPTRPPRRKRPNSQAQQNRVRRLLRFFNSLNDQAIDTEPERVEDDDQSDSAGPYQSYFEEGGESSPQQVQRRGVTEDSDARPA